jgi:hypothetical protein
MPEILVARLLAPSVAPTGLYDPGVKLIAVTTDPAFQGGTFRSSAAPVLHPVSLDQIVGAIRGSLTGGALRAGRLPNRLALGESLPPVAKGVRRNPDPSRCCALALPLSLAQPLYRDPVTPDRDATNVAAALIAVVPIALT